MDFGGGFMQFFVGILVFVLDVWALIDIWSSHKDLAPKILWSLLVLFFPVVGLIIYALLGRGRLASTP